MSVSWLQELRFPSNEQTTDQKKKTTTARRPVSRFENSRAPTSSLGPRSVVRVRKVDHLPELVSQRGEKPAKLLLDGDGDKKGGGG